MSCRTTPAPGQQQDKANDILAGQGELSVQPGNGAFRCTEPGQELLPLFEWSVQCTGDKQVESPMHTLLGRDTLDG